MANFEKPIPDETFKMNIDKTKGEYENLSANILVKSPYDGVVVDSSKLNCNGSFRIEHKVGERKFFSNFCNLGKQTFQFDNPVPKGKKIGETMPPNPNGKPENLEYWITNENKEKQNLENFFKGKVDGMEDKKEKKDDNKEKKAEVKKDTSKKQSKSSSSSSSSSSYGGSSSSSTPLSKGTKFEPKHSLFLAPFDLSPFPKSLSEEIIRMKKLMK